MPRTANHTSTLKLLINYLLGPLLFIWMSYSIYMQVKRQPNLEESWWQIRSAFSGLKLWNLVGVVLLMVVNWGIEAAKWRLAVKGIQRVSWATAYKAVLSGVSFSITTPNRVGEYLGRILYMDEGNRLKAISLTITGSISQLMVTLAMGLIGLFVLHQPVLAHGLISPGWWKIFVIGTAVALSILTVIYFRIAWLAKWVDRWPATRRFAWLIDTLEGFNATLLLRLLSLSAIRFLVFIVQYFLLFRLFNVDLMWWQGCWTVSISFLVLAIIPTIALFTDLGLRGGISLKLVGMFSSNSLGIGFTSVTIWVINLIIPALAGSLLILSIKGIFKKPARPGVN